jgi:hypothetical protein
MGDRVFNIALGRALELHNRVKFEDPSSSRLVVVLLRAVETEEGLIDRSNLWSLLNSVDNTEANFTGYSRKVLAAADLDASVVNLTTNVHIAVLPELTWANAGGATDNSLVKLLVCYVDDYAMGVDDDYIPLVALDFVTTTDGDDLVALSNADGYISAASM